MERLDSGDKLVNLHETFWDGIRKTLWWAQANNHVFVNVLDERNDESFTVTVEEGENPMYVFQHALARTPYDIQQRKLYAGTEADQ